MLPSDPVRPPSPTPVTDKSGMLVGILTLDDLLRVLAAELGEVAKLIDREQVKEMKTRV